MTFHISADMRISPLQCEEYLGIQNVYLRDLGYQYQADFLDKIHGATITAFDVRQASDQNTFVVSHAMVTDNGFSSVSLLHPFRYYKDQLFKFNSKEELFSVDWCEPVPMFWIHNGIWAIYDGTNYGTKRWKIPNSTPNRYKYLEDGSSFAKLFSTIDGSERVPFHTVENDRNVGWAPADQGVRIDVGSGGGTETLQKVNRDTGDAYWVCLYNFPGEVGTGVVKMANVVNMTRNEFGTPRATGVMRDSVVEIMNQSRTAHLSELKFSMNALFEYGNDQLVYRNSPEIPAERTNLIPTGKAPGVF